VLHRNNQNEMFMEFDSPESVDIRTVDGYRDPSNPNMYKIKVVFGKKMEYLFTEYVQQEPVLNIYFLKPDFVEDKVAPTDSDIPTYTFPVPTSNYRYNKIQFDLRQISVIYYPIADKVPSIRKLDTDMGVEITLTIAELDQMNIYPDFILYVTADMKTTVTEPSGKITVINSWDAAGYGANVPQVDIGTSGDDGDGKDGLNPLVIIIPVIIILVILIALLVLLILLLGKKGKKDDKDEPEPIYVPPQDQSLDDMIFGNTPQKMTAEQMYGPPQPQGEAVAQGLPTEGLSPVQQQGGALTQGQPTEGLPPVQPQGQGGPIAEGPLPDSPQ
ncbi:MAG: hypothetical protein ACMUFK_01620, partial [Thermoplasmatota archaeon]